jgi:hypothetical protein
MQDLSRKFQHGRCGDTIDYCRSCRRRSCSIYRYQRHVQETEPHAATSINYAIFGGLFDANKGLDILISQIDDSQARVNSMGVSPTLKLIIKNINDIQAEVKVLDAATSTFRRLNTLLKAAILRAASLSPLTWPREIPQMPTISPIDFSATMKGLTDVIHYHRHNCSYIKQRQGVGAPSRADGQQYVPRTR